MLTMAHRALLSPLPVAAAAPSFDPDFEHSPDPGFDNAGVWTVTRCAVAAKCSHGYLEHCAELHGYGNSVFVEGYIPLCHDDSWI